jgi:hypothetical protein
MILLEMHVHPLRWLSAAEFTLLLACQSAPYFSVFLTRTKNSDCRALLPKQDWGQTKLCIYLRAAPHTINVGLFSVVERGAQIRVRK